MKITALNTNVEILAELGTRLRDIRLAKPLTRAELSQTSGVSARTIANIEAGRDASFGNILSIMRALNILEGADALAPSQEIRPSDYAALGKKRVRATSPKYRKPQETSWVWGDEK